MSRVSLGLFIVLASWSAPVLGSPSCPDNAEPGATCVTTRELARDPSFSAWDVLHDRQGFNLGVRTWVAGVLPSQHLKGIDVHAGKVIDRRLNVGGYFRLWKGSDDRWGNTIGFAGTGLFRRLQASLELGLTTTRPPDRDTLDLWMTVGVQFGFEVISTAPFALTLSGGVTTDFVPEEDDESRPKLRATALISVGIQWFRTSN